ncbi:MFS general substrate transporter [Mycena sanguinolenta]|uniref:MFS general substrate transporter n=1 Tax=Mycena sanguinolenta TaxID=230812 RepID=A0A8H6Y694_9AGAR|nr:MFS general substrate transporter [Mycena sanguinolenta]
MDLHADSEAEVIVLSTSDNVESTPYVLFVCWFNLAPLKILRRRLSPRQQTRKKCQTLHQTVQLFAFASERKLQILGNKRSPPWETKPRRQATEHTVNKYYSYHIAGGFGGSGGDGHNQGGDGGIGQGPTVYFGQPQERELSEFQTIRLGDLKLIKEVRLSLRSGVVGCQSRGVGVRRIYHAEIRRDPGTVTVVMYQGDGAMDEWRQHVAKYESIRHPHVMQLYGLVSTKRLYAMVFHDELIPYRQFLRCFQHSAILTTYIMGYCNTELKEATSYIEDVFGPLMDVSTWIRPSTGELCLDLAQSGPETNFGIVLWETHVLHLESVSLDAPDSEDAIISSLGEDQYHEICSWPSFTRFQFFQVSTEHPIGPGIFRSDSQHETCVRITEPLKILLDKELNWDNHGNAPDELMPNSWIRYDSHRTNTLWLELRLPFWAHGITKAWLAQANCIFAELEETTHVEDYVCIYTVEFTLRIADERDTPEGYLFLCPSQDFCTGTEPHANLYQWPACPAYWSLNPSGADRLSTEDTKNLGFPAIHIETRMFGRSWDHSIYEGLRRFHQGKGFDPDGREVARRLGYPLYEVLSDRVPFSAREGIYQCDFEDLELCRELSHFL